MHLPVLELPSLSLSDAIAFEIPSDFAWSTAAAFTNPQGEDSQPASPLALSDELKFPGAVHSPEKTSNPVVFITNFECEEASGFGADLLWGYVNEQKGGASPTTSNAPAAKSASKEAAGNYHQQQRGKPKAPAAKQGAGTNRGELSSNAAGAQIINLKEEDYETDWYEILAITDEGIGEADLKAAFRKRCLDTHPDKCKGSDELFKKVQKGFEILSNPDARRQYDSSRPFDDSVPPTDMTFDENPAEFFGMFKPVFARNARWSVAPINVDIGNEKTPIAEVRKFYDVWMSFRSWRDFSHTAELEDIHEDMPRYEKRFYQQENERILNSAKKQEAKRIRSLVDRAMAADPRIRAENRRREEERLAVLEAKKQAELEIHREQNRKEEEEKNKEAVAKKQAEEAAVRLRHNWKDSKQAVLDKFKEAGLLRDDSSSKSFLEDGVNIANIDWIFSKVSQAKNPEVAAEKLTSVDDDELVSNFNAYVTSIERSVFSTRYGEPIGKKKAEEGNKLAEEQAAAAAKKRKESAAAKMAASGAASAGSWTEQDIIELTKAIAKYPGGTVDRWRKIAAMLREKFTDDQILNKTKQLEHATKSGGAAAGLTQAANASANPGDDWHSSQQSQLEEGLRALKDYKEKDKWIKVEKYVDGKSAKECFERYKHLAAVAQKAAGSKN